MDKEDRVQFKKQVLSKIKELDGWCSDKKASFLMDFVLKKRPTIAVEIGVYGGKSLIPVAFAMKYNGHGKIYGIDPWIKEASMEGMEGVNLEWWGNLDHNVILDKLNLHIKNFNLEKYIELIRKTSKDCKNIPNIDIIHIDGNHSEKSAYYDVTKWVPLVKKGGYIILDDLDWDGTRKAVSWLNAHCEKVLEVSEGNIWAVWKKK